MNLSKVWNANWKRLVFLVSKILCKKCVTICVKKFVKGIICLPLVGIGLTDLPNIEMASGPPGPPGPPVPASLQYIMYPRLIRPQLLGL